MDVKQTHVAVDLVHNSPLISCRFDRTGKYVFAGAQDYNVWRFEIASGAKVALPTENWVRGIVCDHAGKVVVTSGYDGRLIWWPVEGEQPEPIRVVAAHDGWIRSLAVNPGDTLLASVGNDLVVRLWNLADGTLVREMTGHESHIYNVAFHPDGKQLVTGDLHSKLIHWDVETGTQLRTWQAESLQKYDPTFKAIYGGFPGMTFDADGKILAVCGITNVTNAFAGVGNPSVVVFDWEKAEKQIEHLSKAKLQANAWGVAIHPTGIRIAAAGGGSGGNLLFWNPSEADEFHVLKLPNTARDMDLSPDGLHVATAHFDGHVRISKLDKKE